MKKIIVQNDEFSYEAKYIFSKKKYATYYYKKIDTRPRRYKYLSFLKKESEHRFCNLGPQYKDEIYTFYKENDKYHNLYGYAYINKQDKIKGYGIYSKVYSKYEFNKYISIYNNLSYKRIY